MTLHAGEALGADSVASAIELGADRIGHGVRSIEKPELLKLLSEKKIALELCPTSNLNTRVLDDLKDYPIRTFFDADVMITVNTDNMSVSATSLAEEYQKLADALELTEAELKKIALCSISATFLDSKGREKIFDMVDIF
jgi:adenosine deaminase